YLVGQNKLSQKDELMRKYYFDLKKISVDENFPSDTRECAKNIFENQEAEQKKRTKIWGHIEQNAQPIETSVPIPSTSNSERGNSLDEALSTSTGVTLVSGFWPPTSVKRWSEFLVDASNLQRRREIREAQALRRASRSNHTCRVFSNGVEKIIFPIEVKRNLVIEDLIWDEELALESTHLRLSLVLVATKRNPSRIAHFGCTSAGLDESDGLEYAYLATIVATAPNPNIML
ncbi:23138_t:CDS:2, partial [Gigaspora margarita]